MRAYFQKKWSIPLRHSLDKVAKFMQLALVRVWLKVDHTNCEQCKTCFPDPNICHVLHRKRVWNDKRV